MYKITSDLLSVKFPSSISFSEPLLTHGLDSGGTYLGGSFKGSGGKTSGGYKNKIFNLQFRITLTNNISYLHYLL